MSVIVVMLLAAPVAAKDYMLSLNDQERAALREILDAAVRANGLVGSVTRNSVFLLDKLNAAPEIVERKDDEQKEPPK
jgi:hypothetical protein